jgi:Domain of unknown function (DUF4760)
MTLDDAARYAPIVTAAVAVLALLVAWRSIHIQRGVARRRAAIDFFLKTEMDEKMLQAYRKFNNGVEELEKATSIEEFSKTDSYIDIRTYLNVHELIGVGIHNKIFDQRICYEFWVDELDRAYRETKPLINYIRSHPGCGETYTDLIRLHERWTGAHWIWQLWRSRWWPLQL